ncbi:MAG: MATE family efflux transporter, partial [Myxococcota bacterium]
MAEAMWRQECKALWVLAFPLVAVQAGDQLKSLVDTAVMGRLGEQELAGVGLGNAFFFLIQLLGVGALMGFDPLIAQ